MQLIGNIIWLVLAGIWLFVAYVVAGILNCIFIITIPFGVQSFTLASFRAHQGRTNSGRGEVLMSCRASWGVDGPPAPMARAHQMRHGKARDARSILLV
jgi:hypothetical protein